MAQTFNTSLQDVASAYSKMLGAKVTSSSVRQSIVENPHYPSLLSLSDTFKRYNIENAAFQVDVEKFDELVPPFIAYATMPETGNDFVLVTSIDKGTITYSHKNARPRSVSKEEFLKLYKKVVFFAEADQKSGEALYEKKKKTEAIARNKQLLWISGLAALVIVSFSISFPSVHGWSYTAISLIKSIGTAIAVLLLIYEVDNTNAFVKNICSLGAKTNCGAVLSSKASKIMGISWGEIGFFYFSATTLWLWLPGLPFADKITWLTIGNAFAAPYIFFSIYYQWRVIKQWCPLCLSIQFLLAAELAWSIIFGWNAGLPFGPATGSLLTIATCILLPVLGWSALKPAIIKAKDRDLYLAAYKRLQHNADMFSGLLQQQPRAADGWEPLGITIGNPEAPTTILKVCSPYCGPCAKAHSQLEEIFEHNSDVRLKIIFTAKNDDSDRSTIVVRHLLAIAAQGDDEKTRRALDDWYLADKKDYDAFAEKYPMNGELKQQNKKIEAMRDWCTESGISFTPTIYINEHRIPENYSLEEVKNIL